MNSELIAKVRKVYEEELPPVFDLKEPEKAGIISRKGLYNLISLGSGPPTVSVAGKKMLERSSFLDWAMQRGCRGPKAFKAMNPKGTEALAGETADGKHRPGQACARSKTVKPAGRCQVKK